MNSYPQNLKLCKYHRQPGANHSQAFADYTATFIMSLWDYRDTSTDKNEAETIDNHERIFGVTPPKKKVISPGIFVLHRRVQQ